MWNPNTIENSKVCAYSIDLTPLKPSNFAVYLYFFQIGLTSVPPACLGAPFLMGARWMVSALRPPDDGSPFTDPQSIVLKRERPHLTPSRSPFICPLLFVSFILYICVCLHISLYYYNGRLTAEGSTTLFWIGTICFDVLYIIYEFLIFGF